MVLLLYQLVLKQCNLTRGSFRLGFGKIGFNESTLKIGPHHNSSRSIFMNSSFSLRAIAFDHLESVKLITLRRAGGELLFQ